MVKGGLSSIAVMLTLMMMTATLSLAPSAELKPADDETNLQLFTSDSIALVDYKLYFTKTLEDEPPSIDGSIVTVKPPTNANQETESAMNGLDFASPVLLSNLAIGGSSGAIELYIFFEFEGPEGAEADLDITLKTRGVQFAQLTETLTGPCSGFFGNACNGVEGELLFFDVGSKQGNLSAGDRIEVSIVVGSTDGCDGGGGFPGTSDCDVRIGFGDIDDKDQFTHLRLRADAMSGSSFRIHHAGAGWNDVETMDWYPNDDSSDRDIQFSVDVRNAFGRADIKKVELLMDDPSQIEGIEVFNHEFTDSELKLDNGGYVGDFTYRYAKGIDHGVYPVQLKITDLQEHVIVATHDPVLLHTYGIDFELDNNLAKTLYVAPAQTSNLTFSLTHIGYASNALTVELAVQPPFSSDWLVEFDQPAGGYSLEAGGVIRKPELTITAPDDDLSETPPNINIIAVAKANNSQIGDPVQISLEVEQIDVFSDPRLTVYDDADHQQQIADSVDSEDYDLDASHFVSFDGTGSFYLDVFNTGFDTDDFRMKIIEIPDRWDATFVDNQSGLEIQKYQGAYPTGSIDSHQAQTVIVVVYPPLEREALDLGTVTVEVMSGGDTSLRATVSFTVQRTFGVHAAVIYDCDASPLGYVNMESVNCQDPAFLDETLRVRITNSLNTSDTKVTTFQVKNPALLDKQVTTPDGSVVTQNQHYRNWNFDLLDEENSFAANVKLAPGDDAEIKLLITPSMGMRSGNHTIFLRVIEEVAEENSDDARYFDMPFTVFIGEDKPEVEITQTSANDLITTLDTEEIEMRIYNVANRETMVLLKVDSDLGEGWKIILDSEDGGEIVNIEPFGEKNFTIRVNSPSCFKHNEVYEFTVSAKPLDTEESWGETYTTKKTVRVQTSVDDLRCRIQAELFYDPDPVTLGVLGAVAAMLIYAIARRRAKSGEEWLEEPSTAEVEPEVEEVPPDVVSEDLPEPVRYVEDIEVVEDSG